MVEAAASLSAAFGMGAGLPSIGWNALIAVGIVFVFVAGHRLFEKVLFKILRVVAKKDE